MSYRSGSAADWRWLAGVIDSEGYISMVERKNGMLSRRIAITNCCLPLLIAVGTIAGGKIHTHTPPNGTNKQQFQWYCYGAVMAYTLKRVLPYLVAKRDEAVVALRLSRSRTVRCSLRLSAADHRARKLLLQEVSTIRARCWTADDVPLAFQPQKRATR